jgi:hypothetical protein
LIDALDDLIENRYLSLGMEEGGNVKNGVLKAQGEMHPEHWTLQLMDLLFSLKCMRCMNFMLLVHCAF